MKEQAVLEGGRSLEYVNRFCYLVDMVTCWEQQGAVKRRLGLECKRLEDSLRSLQRC